MVKTKFFYLVIVWVTTVFSLVEALGQSDFEPVSDSAYTVSTFLLGSAGAVGVSYLVSEMKDGPAFFSGLYSFGALYFLTEGLGENSSWEDFIMPIGLITMAIANVALLSDENEYDSKDIFVANSIGSVLLSSYFYWSQNFSNSYAWRPKWLLLGNSHSVWLGAHLRF